MGLAVSAISTRSLPARILSNVSAKWLGAVVSIACECDSCGRREPSLLSANHSRAPSVKRPGLPRASSAAGDVALLVGAELEVQLGTSDPEIGVPAAKGGRNDLNRRSASRGEGADDATVKIVVVEIEVQALEAEGHGRRAEPVHGQGPLDATANNPAGIVIRIRQTTGGVDQDAI